jgi:glycosyltransferase involved in cell wall biosynthesis
MTVMMASLGRTRQLRIFFPATAHLLTDHLPHGEGLIAYNLLSGLAARGHAVVGCAHALALSETPQFRVSVLGHGGPLQSLAPLGYAGLAARQLRRQGGVDGFDVAHWLFPQGADQMLDASPRRLPLVVGPLTEAWPSTVRHLTLGSVARRVAQPVFVALNRRAMGRAARVLVAAPEVTHTLNARYRERAVLVPFGIHTANYPVAPLPSRPSVLFVGRLDRSKGVCELLEAFASVQSAVPGARLRFVGDGPEAGWLERRVGQLEMRASVELLRPVPHREIPTLLSECSLMCLPSHGEPFGMAILEAMAAGRAVIAGDRGGPRHLVHGGGGVRVAPGDARGLAAALISLLGDRARLEAMGAFNRERVEREFSWTVVIDALERVYADAIASRRAQSWSTSSPGSRDTSNPSPSSRSEKRSRA